MSTNGPAVFLQFPCEVSMNESITFLIDSINFSDAVPKDIGLKYSMYMFAITGDYGEPIAMSSSC